MPHIKFVFHMDEGEKVNVYVNDSLLDADQDSCDVEERFELKVEQFRVHNEKHSAIKDILSFIIGPIFDNDRFKSLKVSERPYYAHYKAECESLSDSEIVITQYKKGFHSLYDVTSQSAVFTDVVKGESVNRSAFRNWIISKIFILVIASSIPLYMLFSVLYEALVDKDLSFTFVGFIVAFCSVFVGVLWYGTFSSISPKKIEELDTIEKRDGATRFYRISSFIWVSLGLVSYFVYSINAEFSSAIPCVGGVGIYIIKSMIFDHIRDSKYAYLPEKKKGISTNTWKMIEFVSVVLYVFLNIVFQSYFLG